MKLFNKIPGIFYSYVLAISLVFYTISATANGFVNDEDPKQIKKDPIQYFNSIKDKESIQILPGDVSTLTLIQPSTDSGVLFTNDEVAFITQNIYFRHNSSEITEIGKRQLEGLAVFMLENTNISVTINCYTDPSGDATDNLALSNKRAVNIKDFVVEKGILADRILALGKGDANPIIDCEQIACSETQRSQNRRAELNIVWNKE